MITIIIVSLLIFYLAGALGITSVLEEGRDIPFRFILGWPYYYARTLFRSLEKIL